MRLKWIQLWVWAALLLLPVAVSAGEQPPALRIYTATDHLLLGADQQTTLQARLPRNTTEFNFQVLYGDVVDVSVKKNGRNIFATYVPPEQFFPAVDMILLTASDGKQTYWGLATVRLIGQGKAKIVTTPEATTHVRIGSKSFGPVTADNNGEAYVDVQVPPGIAFGIDNEGNEVDLQVPPLQRIAIFTASGTQINLDETQEEEVLVIVLDEKGKLVRDADSPSVKADFGAIQDLERIAPGVYHCMYVVPKKPQTVTFSVYDGNGDEMHNQQFEIVGEADYSQTNVVKIEPEPKPRKTVEKPKKQEPAPLTPGQQRYFVSGMLGINTNFSNWASPSGKISFAMRVLEQPMIGVGYQFGILYNSYEDQFDTLDGRVTSKTLLFPNLLFIWFRNPLVPKWFVTPMLAGGIAFAHNTITQPGASENVERKIIFSAEASVALEREIGPGMFFSQLGVCFSRPDLFNLRGRMFVGELVLGYRYAFGS
ncbi:MAG: hypothetical protein JXX29_00865 [Deltaproteobacteria bacterium]|nr:hypothetical protein [Deltaproteobacteria bacterium]MBN2670189.1 hypothetical protein [Deltaproteobacteria bacterium]